MAASTQIASMRRDWDLVLGYLTGRGRDLSRSLAELAAEADDLARTGVLRRDVAEVLGQIARVARSVPAGFDEVDRATKLLDDEFWRRLVHQREAGAEAWTAEAGTSTELAGSLAATAQAISQAIEAPAAQTPAVSTTGGYADYVRDTWLKKIDRWPEDAEHFRANAERDYQDYSGRYPQHRPGEPWKNPNVGWVAIDKVKPFREHTGAEFHNRPFSSIGTWAPERVREMAEEHRQATAPRQATGAVQVPDDWDRFRGHPLGADKNGVSYHYYPAEGGRWPVVKARVGETPDGDLQNIADLTWFDADGPGATKNAVQMIEVNPDFRRQGIATRLWDHARAVNPDLIHSPTDQLPAGKGWAAAVDAREPVASAVAAIPEARGDVDTEKVGAAEARARANADIEAGVARAAREFEELLGALGSAYRPPELPEEQRAALEPPGNWNELHGHEFVEAELAHQRRVDEFAAHPVPGTKVWRGENRVVDEHGAPDHSNMGLHWSVNPGRTINHANAPMGQRQVIWQSTVEHPDHVIPRDHSNWNGDNGAKAREAEVRFQPGTQVKVDGAWVWHGKPWRGGPLTGHEDPADLEPPGTFAPLHPERMHPGWRWHPVNERSPVTNEHGQISYGDRLPNESRTAALAPANVIGDPAGRNWHQGFADDGKYAGNVEVHRDPEDPERLHIGSSIAFDGPNAVNDPEHHQRLREAFVAMHPDKRVTWKGQRTERPEFREPMPGDSPKLPEGLSYHEELGQRPNERFLHATREGKPVGHLHWTTGPSGAVEMIKVSPEHQRQGVATALWDRARRLDPEIRHSPVKTPDGSDWAAHEHSRRQAVQHRAPVRVDTPEYRKAYTRGWNSSKRETGMDRADARGGTQLLVRRLHRLRSRP